MKHELTDYAVFPKILKSGEKSCITIKPLGRHAAFESSAEYLIRFLPMDESIEPAAAEEYEGIIVKPQDGYLYFEHVFNGEQVHYLRIFRLPESKKPIITLRVFSLLPDLYCRRPYRGDFHVHTCCSDGHEEPAIVAANYRRNGFDFLAITDHYRWYPSEEAISAYEGTPIDLKLFHGEEVHPPATQNLPRNHVHMVNFGGSFSINELFEKEPERYEREVIEIMKCAEVPDGVNPYEYASCVWCFEEIRKAGGLAIFCHPHWVADVYHVPERMTDFLFEKKPFDAFELLGGHEVFSNNMQTAYYDEARAKGLRIPIVGASDSHGTEDARWFNWLYTLVFSKDMELCSIRDSVKDFYSVAVECYPGEHFRVHGPYRLVKYALFLLDEYFPPHDMLCFEEGRLMKDYICGDRRSLDILKTMQGRTSEFLEHCYSGNTPF